MKRFLALALLASLLVGSVTAQAATEVKMSGDSLNYVNYWSHFQYTGWNYNGTQTSDPMPIYSRFRLKTDFIANENLKFRLGIRVNNKVWGNSAFTVDNPAVVIDVYQAFMQFKWPGSDVMIRAGLQDFDLPLSVEWLGANPVLGGTRAAAAMVEIPFGDVVKVIGGFTRLLDTNTMYDPTTKQVPDELDGYFLTLPITTQGFAATPWGMLAVAGKSANYAGTWTGNGGLTNENLYNNLFSAGTKLTPTGFSNGQNIFWWVGTTLTVTAADPFKFYGDIIYGAGAQNDRQKNRRSGWFFDVAAEYTGFDMVTPQLTFWYGSGEDSSTRNGSERMPFLVNCWGPSNSILFDTNQDFGAAGAMGQNPMGSWGLVFALEKITFVKDLSHRVAVSYAQGTNSSRALRDANALYGIGNYVQLGRDLTTNEHVWGVNFDHQYNIYENLALIAETGWAHGTFEKSVWGARFVHNANAGDAWKIAIGFKYKF